MLAKTDPAERNNCCGPSTRFGCGTDGTPMQSKNGTGIDGCNANWCLRSIGNAWLGSGNPTARSTFPDFAMLSTKTYQQSLIGVHRHLGVHHFYRLAADWALIDDADARATV